MSKLVVDVEWLKKNVDAVCCPERFSGNDGWKIAPCNEANGGEVECVDCWIQYGEGFHLLTPAQERALEGWISVEVAIPAKAGKYKVRGIVGSMSPKPFETEEMLYKQRLTGGQFSSGDWQTVTHWMPLPEPPQGKEGEKDEKALR